MIIQNNDGLVCTETGRRWSVEKSGLRPGLWVVGLLFPPTNLERESTVLSVLGKSQSEDECRAFLASLAVRLGAWRWDSDKRCFVRVESERCDDIEDVNG